MNINISGLIMVGQFMYVTNIDQQSSRDRTEKYDFIEKLKKDNIIYGNALNKDSLLVYVGGKTGNDGIGGADMASKSFTKNT